MKNKSPKPEAPAPKAAQAAPIVAQASLPNSPEAQAQNKPAEAAPAPEAKPAESALSNRAEAEAEVRPAEAPLSYAQIPDDSDDAADSVPSFLSYIRPGFWD